MRYELWATPDRTSWTFAGADSIENYKAQGAIETDAEFVWAVEADTYDKAMQLHCDYMGYGTYKPMDE